MVGKLAMVSSNEKAITKTILSYLNHVPGCHAEKRHGTAFGFKGQPDITGCLLILADGKRLGLRLEIEVKVPGREQATPLQQARLKGWADVGALTGVVHSVAEVQALIQPWLLRRD